MMQKITQNNWNFWTVNLIMRAKNVNQSSDFPVGRTGSYRHKKHCSAHPIAKPWDISNPNLHIGHNDAAWLVFVMQQWRPDRYGVSNVICIRKEVPHDALSRI